MTGQGVSSRSSHSCGGRTHDLLGEAVHPVADVLLVLAQLEVEDGLAVGGSVQCGRGLRPPPPAPSSLPCTEHYINRCHIVPCLRGAGSIRIRFADERASRAGWRAVALDRPPPRVRCPMRSPRAPPMAGAGGLGALRRRGRHRVDRPAAPSWRRRLPRRSRHPRPGSRATGRGPHDDQVPPPKPRRARPSATRRAPHAAKADLPAGVESLPISGAGETMFWIPAAGALVPGDRIIGARAGAAALLPSRGSATSRAASRWPTSPRAAAAARPRDREGSGVGPASPCSPTAAPR